MRFRASPPIRALLGAALALAAGLLLPGVASATCGDYVHIQTADAPAGPRPCHGPECSKAPAGPAVPLTAPVLSADSDQSSVVVEASSDNRPASGEAARHNPSVVSIRLTSTIFHPPRAI